MAWQQPWHQRFGLTRAPREWARRLFFRAAGAAARTDEGRDLIIATLDDLLASRPSLPSTAVETEPPYRDLGRGTPSERKGRPVIITARFRSGSTLLWNIFRHVAQCTAYYEPFNERRWFDKSARGSRIDPTHRGVENYWEEYDGLSELSAYYREDWIKRRLYMDAAVWDPGMAAYVRTLVERAPKRPILQFNRIDFRLPWFTATFPEAIFLHLYRHPRSQWCSTLPDWTACPAACSMEQFARNDHYYLLMWADDLKARFPFLSRSSVGHPYQLFYYIWKLSFWFGIAYADYSLSFDALSENPERELRRLLAVVDLPDANLERLCRLVDSKTPRWSGYAPDGWFKEHEMTCENVLQEFFRPRTRSESRDADNRWPDRLDQPRRAVPPIVSPDGVGDSPRRLRESGERADGAGAHNRGTTNAQV